MPDEDRQKWDAKYTAAADAPHEPSPLLTSLADILPRAGRALDVAGGAGRHAIWLAARGLDVTLTDISEVGLAIARRRAAESGVSLRTIATDLERDEFPAGPWDLILAMYYLWRPLFSACQRELRPGGTLVVVQPTRTNLTRHQKPSLRYLLSDGELPTLVAELEIMRYEEGWLAEGRHEAMLVAQRPR